MARQTVGIYLNVAMSWMVRDIQVQQCLDGVAGKFEKKTLYDTTTGVISVCLYIQELYRSFEVSTLNSIIMLVANW